MPLLIVCPLSRVDEFILDHAPSRLVSLLDPASMIDTPATLSVSSHLKLSVNDIPMPRAGLVAPSGIHVQALIDFVGNWNGAEPILIHCWAGVSRSTASAFIAACLLNPETAELKISHAIRDLSPTATPNTRLVALADDLLGRKGAMVDAITAIGRGEDCYEGIPFSIAARWTT